MRLLYAVGLVGDYSSKREYLWDFFIGVTTSLTPMRVVSLSNSRAYFIWQMEIQSEDQTTSMPKNNWRLSGSLILNVTSNMGFNFCISSNSLPKRIKSST